MLSLEDILANTPAQVVGGEIMVYHQNTHITLGNVTATGVVTTDEGDAYFAELAAPSIAVAAQLVQDAIELAGAFDDPAVADAVPAQTVDEAVIDQAALAAALG